MADARHIVLVHGAWQGSWAFDAWLPHLRARGWTPHAVDLPGNGWGPQAHAAASLASYTQAVVSLLDRLEAPAVVLGHSGGGITASQVAEAVPRQVRALVYLAGMMLPSGVAYASLVRECALERPDVDLAGITPHLQWSDDGAASSVGEAGALACFLQDCPPEAARRAAALLRPQPESGRAMTNTLHPERYGRVPRIYVECLKDRSVHPLVQQRMQQRSPGALRLPLDCGHVPQLACPQALAHLLCPALDALPPLSPSLS
ncbi:MAG: alpha/beta hydrolase, partial [Comamonadaceae bacterium]